MNSDTGKVYEGEGIAKALEREEKLVPISKRVYDFTIAARAERARKLKKQRRVRDKMQKESRRKNR